MREFTATDNGEAEACRLVLESAVLVDTRDYVHVVRAHKRVSSMTSCSQRALRAPVLFPREHLTTFRIKIMGKKSTAGSGKALAKTTQEVASNGIKVSRLSRHTIFFTLLYIFRFDGYISR